MSYNHAVVWMDHTCARIIYFTGEAAEKTVVKAHLDSPHLHNKSGSPDSGHVPENKRFFDDVTDVIKDAHEILLVGPSIEKTLFAKYLATRHPSVSSKVMGVENADHPSDAQLVSHARKFFVKADLYH